MRYLSLCSGIEAASVAWLPLGWECVAVAEIEPFPCRVLKHHYSHVPNLGNVDNITNKTIADLGHIDVTIFGFPCQDLSVAGQRKGFKHADGTKTRSGLFFKLATIAQWARSRWTVVENVPGLFSSNDGRDFAAVVGELAGTEFNVPGDGWRTSGMALGPLGLVEWIFLDAQFSGLAQRRERVFIIRDSGDWSNRPPIFPFAESLRWHPSESRKAGQDVAGTFSASTQGGGGFGTDFECVGGVVAQTLGGKGGRCRIDEDYIAHTLNAKGGSGRIDAESETFVTQSFAQNQLGEVRLGIVANTLGLNSNASGRNTPMIHTTPCVAFRTAGNCGPFEQGDKTAALNTATDPNQNILLQRSRVRRLTPMECLKLQGFPPDYLDIPGEKDGPKYKAIGNSFPVPVVRWIGERIQKPLATIA